MIRTHTTDGAVVTGIGVVNAVANDFPSFTHASSIGKGSLSLMQNFDSVGLRNNKLCQAQNFDHRKIGLSMGERRMDRSSAMVITAWHEALEMAHLDPAMVQSERGAVALGTTLGGSNNGLDYYKHRQSHDPRPSWLRDYNLHAPGYRICIETGFKGPNYVYSTACTSSNLAISMARDLIHQNVADVVIAGGFDTLSLVTCAGFSVMRNVSPDLCRPFDRARNGLVLGEGAAILIIERESFALSRGADPLAVVQGSAITSDAYHMTAPDTSAVGSTRCIELALANAGTTPDKIDFIAAHGTGTPHNDMVEARAIAQVFGENTATIPIASIKSAIGHTLGAAGAMNAVAAIAARISGAIPSTLNHRQSDQGSTLLISSEPQWRKPSLCLSNSLGFGGANCSLVMELTA